MPLVEKREEPKPEKDRRKHPRDYEGLLKQLWSNSPLERRYAVVDLTEYPQAVKALEERLKVEEDNSVKDAIVNALYRIGTEEAVTVLVNLLKSEDAYLRNQAIEVLSQISEKVEDHLKSLISSEDPDLRIFSVNLMSSLKNPKVINWLGELLEKEEDPRVAGVALDLLAELATEDFRPILKKIRTRFKDYEYIQFVLDLIERRLHG
ncbi:MAG: HEAT repeat domain-containing protein [Thermodesulfobacterium sp.]|nr:HEAT repeat domain-containing protein [Thermodesulfobacterium sp.]